MGMHIQAEAVPEVSHKAERWSQHLGQWGREKYFQEPRGSVSPWQGMADRCQAELRVKAYITHCT